LSGGYIKELVFEDECELDNNIKLDLLIALFKYEFGGVIQSTYFYARENLKKNRYHNFSIFFYFDDDCELRTFQPKKLSEFLSTLDENHQKFYLEFLELKNSTKKLTKSGKNRKFYEFLFRVTSEDGCLKNVKPHCCPLNIQRSKN
jgi:hypothetical protein